jgi:hypothetical protein
MLQEMLLLPLALSLVERKVKYSRKATSSVLQTLFQEFAWSAPCVHVSVDSSLCAVVAAGGPTELLKLAEHYLEAGASASLEFIARLL